MLTFNVTVPVRTDHAVLSASGAERWLHCPGSIRLSKDMPRKSSEYAKLGTCAHYLCEQCLVHGSDAALRSGDIIKVENTDHIVDSEMADCVQIYLDTVRAVLKEAGPGAELKIEQRFNLDWLYPGLFGTNDSIITQPFGRITVIDYKHGSGVAVDVTNNPQLMYYGVGAAHGDAYEEIELIIVQPRAIHPDGPVRRQLISIDELDAWAKNVLLPGAIAATQSDAPLATGEHCRFCPALAICPQQRQLAHVTAASVFAKVEPKPPQAMTPQEIGQILDVAPKIEAWLGAIRDYAKNLLESGKISSSQLGYKMIQGRASRAWKDEAEAKAWLESIIGQEAYITKLVSPAQAEKALKTPVAKQALKEMIVVEYGTQMVSVSDKREEITPQPMLLTAVEEP